MRIVIIEDEKPAARRLNRLLDNLGYQVEAMLHSVSESITWFQENQHPDLILLDIQLSDGLSFEIFESVDVKSAIIFTTAYDEYALKAFKLNSVDYLLKPIDKDELVSAINKFNTNHNKESQVQVNLSEIHKLLQNPYDTKYKERFSIKVGQHIKMVAVTDIETIYSKDKSTFIATDNGREYLIDKTLDDLTNELNPDVFYRVSRKFYVNINAIKDIVSYTNSRLELKLNRFTEEQIIVSRERVKDFKMWIEG